MIEPVDTLPTDPFGARAPLTGHPEIAYYRLAALDEAGVASTTRLPYTVRVLLEILLRNAGGIHVSEADVRALASWPAPAPAGTAVPFLPARVHPAGLHRRARRRRPRRDAQRHGARRPRRQPASTRSCPADLVIDHSVQVDAFGTRFAYARNIEREYERNAERYALLRWAQGAFDGFRVVPPGMGIVHQVNLEHLGPRRAAARGRARHGGACPTRSSAPTRTRR